VLARLRRGEGREGALSPQDGAAQESTCLASGYDAFPGDAASRVLADGAIDMASDPIELSRPRVLKAIPLAALVLAVAVAGCGFSSGSARAESAVRDVFGQTDKLGTLESVSCEHSKAPQPDTQAELVFYDCQVTTTEDGKATWCLVDGPAGMAPLPVSCASGQPGR
jgi:hypothetical protein